MVTKTEGKALLRLLNKRERELRAKGAGWGRVARSLPTKPLAARLAATFGDRADGVFEAILVVEDWLAGKGLQ